MKSNPTAEIDRRFSDPEADPTPWPEALHVLEHAELDWLTTVRNDGRPHVTPLIGVAEDAAVHFCTGLREQKARNLERNGKVALITGNNTWTRGLDVVVEGVAVRVTDQQALQRLADAYEAKYGSEWHFEVGDGVFGAGRGCCRRVPDRAEEDVGLRQGAARPDHVPAHRLTKAGGGHSRSRLIRARAPCPGAGSLLPWARVEGVSRAVQALASPGRSRSAGALPLRSWDAVRV
jgi:general stress protein 26